MQQSQLFKIPFLTQKPLAECSSAPPLFAAMSPSSGPSSADVTLRSALELLAATCTLRSLKNIKDACVLSLEKLQKYQEYRYRAFKEQTGKSSSSVDDDTIKSSSADRGNDYLAEDVEEFKKNGVNMQELIHPFKLSCESGKYKPILVALDGLQKLLLIGFFMREDPPGVWMIDGIISMICKCADQATDEAVMLQVIRCILSGTTSTKCSVNGSSLILCVRTVFSIFRDSRDIHTQKTAQAGLIQIVTTMLNRIESQEHPTRFIPAAMLDVKKLQQVDDKTKEAIFSEWMASYTHQIIDLVCRTHHMEASSVDPTRRNSFNALQKTEMYNPSTTTHTAESSSIPTHTNNRLTNATTDVSTEDLSPTPLPIEESLGLRGDNKGSSRATQSAASPPSVSNLLRDSLVNEIGEAAGSYGWCIVCRKCANHFCRITGDPVCGMPCKMINMKRLAVISPETFSDVLVAPKSGGVAGSEGDNERRFRTQQSGISIDGDANGGSLPASSEGDQLPPEPCSERSRETHTQQSLSGKVNAHTHTAGEGLSQAATPGSGAMPVDGVDAEGTKLVNSSKEAVGSDYGSLCSASTQTPFIDYSSSTRSAAHSGKFKNFLFTSSKKKLLSSASFTRDQIDLRGLGGASMAAGGGPTTNLTLPQRDALLLFQSLCKVSMKDLPPGTSPDPRLVRSKLLALELIHLMLKNHGKISKENKLFVGAIKSQLFFSLIKNSVSHISEVSSLSFSIFLTLVTNFKEDLRSELGVFVDQILLPMIESDNSTLEHKQRVLDMFTTLFTNAEMALEFFLNFDCDVDEKDLFYRLIDCLCKFAQGKLFTAEHRVLPQNQQAELQRLALVAVVAMIESVWSWMKKVDMAKEKEASENEAASQSVVVDPGVESDEDYDESSASAQHHAHAQSAPQEGHTGALYKQLKHKSMIQRGVMKFNLKPKNGLQFLISNMLLKDDPLSIAKFFSRQDGLNKTQIGDYLGEDQEPNKSVLNCFVDLLEFKNLEIDAALKKFLKGFRLPGEAQKIDRMMEKFAERYTIDNPKKFENADCPYVLAFSLIMLHTDAHSREIKPENKMTKAAFVRNNRGINQGSDLDREYLEMLYDRIVNDEWVLDEDLARRGKISSYNEESGVASALSLGQPTRRKFEFFLQEMSGMVTKSTELIKMKRTNNERGYVFATPDQVVYVQYLLEAICWPLLATFSVLLEVSDDIGLASLCVKGFSHCISIAARYNMTTQKQSFIESVEKFTNLSSSKELKQKNIECIKLLLYVGVVEGDKLGESWLPILRCISHVERLRLLAHGMIAPEVSPSYVERPGSFADIYGTAAYPFDAVADISTSERYDTQRQPPNTRRVKSLQGMPASTAPHYAHRDSPSVTYSDHSYSRTNFPNHSHISNSPEASVYTSHHLPMHATSVHPSTLHTIIISRKSEIAQSLEVLGIAQEPIVNPWQDIAVSQHSSQLSTLLQLSSRRKTGNPYAHTTYSGGGELSSGSSAVGLEVVDAAIAEIKLSHSNLLSQVDLSEIDLIFNKSVNLSAPDIIHFVSSLCEVSRSELSLLAAPRLFCLQKMVEVADYNMNRIRLIWSRIWNILRKHFAEAALHPSVSVSMYAIDSLRQLAIKFLEKDELAQFHFQLEFLKPFLAVFTHTTTKEQTKEYIIHVAFNMVQSRDTRFKSGWKLILHLLSASALDLTIDPSVAHFPVERLALTFSVCQYIIYNDLLLVLDNVGELVRCLMHFASNPIDEQISLEALRLLEGLARIFSETNLYFLSDLQVVKARLMFSHPLDEVLPNGGASCVLPENASSLEENGGDYTVISTVEEGKDQSLKMKVEEKEKSTASSAAKARDSSDSGGVNTPLEEANVLAIQEFAVEAAHTRPAGENQETLGNGSAEVSFGSSSEVCVPPDEEEEVTRQVVAPQSLVLGKASVEEHPQLANEDYWFPVLSTLAQLSCMPACTHRARRHALDALFNYLKHFGSKLCDRYKWKMIFKGVLFPLFDDLFLHLYHHIKMELSFLGKPQKPPTNSGNAPPLAGFKQVPSLYSGVGASSSPTEGSNGLLKGKHSAIPSDSWAPRGVEAAGGGGSSLTGNARSVGATPHISSLGYGAVGVVGPGMTEIVGGTHWTDADVWGALENLVSLFHCHFDELDFLLNDMLSILISAMEDQPELVARLGVEALKHLLETIGERLDEAAWDTVGKNLARIFRKTCPVALIPGSAVESMKIDNFRGYSKAMDKLDGLRLYPPAEPGSNELKQLDKLELPTELGFDAPNLITKCVLQLLLIDLIQKVLPHYWRKIPITTIIMLLQVLEESFIYARIFNEQIALRNRLQNLGFMADLPQLPGLLKQERDSLSAYFTITSLVLQGETLKPPSAAANSPSLSTRLHTLSASLSSKNWLQNSPENSSFVCASSTSKQEICIFLYMKTCKWFVEEYTRRENCLIRLQNTPLPNNSDGRIAKLELADGERQIVGWTPILLHHVLTNLLRIDSLVWKMYSSDIARLLMILVSVESKDIRMSVQRCFMRLFALLEAEDGSCTALGFPELRRSFIDDEKDDRVYSGNE